MTIRTAAINHRGGEVDYGARADRGPPAGDILSDYLSSPDAIGSAMLYAYQLPQHVCTREIIVAPTAQKA